MSQEWYLLKSPHDQLSGFEDDALNDFAQEGFEEILDSEIAVDVEICNYDLSECVNKRVVIQNNVQDTRLKTLSRQMLAPIGTAKAGMYVKYKNRYWLIIGLVDDNTMYEKAILVLCNHLLTWLNKDNKVVQRWVNATSASQYNNGETGVKFYYVRSDQLLILTPDDDECLLLTSGDRFIMDKRCKIYERNFTDEIICDTSNPVTTYELTRSDSVLYDYQDSGHFEFMAYQTEQHVDDGYYVINGNGYWLCKKPIEVNQIKILSSIIECDSSEIFNGLEPGIFTAVFYDKNGNKDTSILPEWSIDSDIANQLDITYVDNSICISANSKELINTSFELSLNATGYETVTTTITIRAFI